MAGQAGSGLGADATREAIRSPVRPRHTASGERGRHGTLLSISSEDGIPEILAEQRLGHDVPGMRGLYAHVSPRMREDLIAALQARWENSLRERASIDPRSPVLLLDNLLAPFRAGQKKTISQIPPKNGNSSHPQRRMRAVSEASELALHQWAILGSNQ